MVTTFFLIPKNAKGLQIPPQQHYNTEVIQKVNSIDDDTRQELGQILSEFMGGDTDDLAFYYKKMIDYLSQKAKSTEVRKNEAGEINKTSLYKFFEGLK